MKLRARRRKPEASIDELLPRFLADGHHAAEVVDWSMSPEWRIEQNETRAFVRTRIDRLPETYRTVLILRDIEELSTEEAASALDISPNAVKIRLHRARQVLMTLLQHESGKARATHSLAARVRHLAGRGGRATATGMIILTRARRWSHMPLPS